MVVTPIDAVSGAILAQATWVGIRQTNYPGSWDRASKNARDLYQTQNTVTKGVKWKCPGAGFKPAHDVMWADITIDHRHPVAAHWNAIGCNSTRLVRSNWSLDTKNHDYLCQPCNSSKGSGNILYTIVREPQYSN